MSAEQLDRAEYERRWSSAARYILRHHVVPIALPTWLLLGWLVVTQPSGPFGALCWFLWLSMLATTGVSVGLAIFANTKAHGARAYPYTWAVSYVEPWYFERSTR